MRVAVVNTHDVHGGAARAAYRLHQGLLAAGAASLYYVRNKTYPDPTIRSYVPDVSPERVRARWLRRAAWTAAYDAYRPGRSPDIELFSPADWDDDANVLRQIPPADVINTHWIARFIDLPLLFDPSRADVPVVWTLHDMNPFTGGCHYDQGCGRYRVGCGACPLLGSEVEADLSRTIFDRKLTALRGWPDHGLHIVAPSKWLLGEALRSALLSRFSGTHIPNAIDTDVYAPAPDKMAARARLGWPAGAAVVLFVANHVKLARKGFTDLVRALSSMPDREDLVLVAVGDGHVPGAPLPFDVRFVPFVRDEAQMVRLYGAADVTAIPSRQDNLPNAILESLSCGTPVVAFAVGGVPEVVADGHTGFLARPDDVAGLGLAFARAFADRDALATLGLRGRALMEREFSIETQARRYLRIFEHAIRRGA